jgi:Xaa-Pro dipeptidase
MANLKYLANVNTDGYLVFPLEGNPTLFSFLEGHEPGSWIDDLRTGHPSYSAAIAERLREMPVPSGAVVGMVGLSGFYGGDVGFPHTAYVALEKQFPSCTFEDATDIIEDARKIKSEEEIRCLELGCGVSDQVVDAIAATAGAGVPESEIVRVISDVLYRGGCEPGSMILYCAGKQHIHAGEGGNWTSPSQRRLEAGDVLLLEWDAKYQGYQAQYNQPFVIGKPSQEWSKIFAVAVASFANGLEFLRPGVSVAELDSAFEQPLREAGYVHRNPHFHGLGLSVEEPVGGFPGQPSFQMRDDVIRPGMVIECQPHVVQSDRKRGLHLGIPVLVTGTGHRPLSERWSPRFISVS